MGGCCGTGGGGQGRQIPDRDLRPGQALGRSADVAGRTSNRIVPPSSGEVPPPSYWVCPERGRVHAGCKEFAVQALADTYQARFGGVVTVAAASAGVG